MEVNVTLISILVIVFLFIPGFFFKRFYFSGQFTKQFTAGTFAERFITNMFWGIVVQCVTIIIIGAFTSWNYESIREPLTNFYNELENGKLPICSGSSFNKFMAYLVITSAVAVCMGFISHKIVRVFKLDVLIPVLRFSNHWNYYFKGDLRNMRNDGRKGKVISTMMDILVSDGEKGTKLYKGFLSDYTISHTTGELENIILIKALRWSNSGKVFKPIAGDSLIILYKTILNINISYNTRYTGAFDKIANVSMASCVVAFPFVLAYSAYTFYDRTSWWKFILIIVIHGTMWLLLSTAIVGAFTEIQKRRASKKTNTPNSPLSHIIIVQIAIIIFVAFLYYISHNLAH